MARKAAIPYPTSPPPPLPPPLEVADQQSHLHVNSADVPPIPSTVLRSRAASDFQEMGNPWAEDYVARSETEHHRPGLLKPETSQAQATSQNKLQNVPDVLRPGWSGEATPRSSLDSDRSPEREWWDDDDADEDKNEEQRPQQPKGLHVVNDTTPISPSSQIKRKPLPQSRFQQQPSLQNAKLASNNPFKGSSETQFDTPMDLPDWGPEQRESREADHPKPLRSHPSSDRLGQLSLHDSDHEKQNVHEAPTVFTPPPPPPPLQAPPPIPQPQAHLIPTLASPSPSNQINTREDGQINPWAPASQNTKIPPPSPSPFEPSKRYTTTSTDNLLDRGQHAGSVSLGSELKALPNAVSAAQPSTSEISLLEDESGPPLPVRPTKQDSENMYAPPPKLAMHQQPPVKPPRPAVVTSEQDLARIREQRNETYTIKHFNVSQSSG